MKFPNSTLLSRVLLIMFTYEFTSLKAQTTGDYRTVASGDWSSTATWERYNGAAWVAATNYPAYGAAAPVTNTVTIRNTGTVRMNISPATGKIVNLIIDTGATLTDIDPLNYTLNATNQIVVNGRLQLQYTSVVTSGLNTPRLIINTGGTLTAFNTTVTTLAQNSGFVRIARTIQGAATWQNLANGYLTFEGAAITSQLNASAIGNTVEYYSLSTNQTIRIPTASYYHLIVSGPGGSSKTLAGNTTVLGNLSIQGTSILNLSSFTISIGGDWNNSSTNTSALAPTTAGRVIFNGSIQQNIINTGHNSGTSFQNLTFANTHPNIPQIRLLNSTGVSTNTSISLTMTSGVIDMGGKSFSIGTDFITLTTLTHSGTAAAGWFYNGIFSRHLVNNATIAKGSNLGFFPVGTSIDFRPLYVYTVTPPTINSAFRLTCPTVASIVDVSIIDGTSTILRQNRSGWAFGSNSGNGTYGIVAGGTGLGIIGNVADLRLTPSSTILGTAGTNSGTNSFPMVERIGITMANTRNNAFYIGSVNLTTSPLPVELVTFTGEAEGTAVNLKWVTRTELNCDYFTVYRSHNGIDFVRVATRKGAGTTKEQRTYEVNDENPWKGINYYRLEQTDLNGSKNSLDMISVEAQGTDAIQFYPTQVSPGQNLYLKLEGLAADTQLELNLINAMGQRMDQYIIHTDANGRFYGEVQMKDISAGFYYLKLNPIAKKLIIY